MTNLPSAQRLKIATQIARAIFAVAEKHAQGEVSRVQFMEGRYPRNEKPMGLGLCEEAMRDIIDTALIDAAIDSVMSQPCIEGGK